MRLVVGIDGFAGAGKTTFAQCIAAAFDSPVVILGTDQFMRYSRAERMANAERLHDHRDWYDTARLGLLLAALRKSNAVKVHVADTYDHATGRSDAPLLIEVTDDSAIIVEGMYALEPEIRQHCDFSFLLTAKDDALLGRIYKRDTSERSIDPGAVLERSSIINGPVYQNFFRRHFTDADAVLDTSADSYQASFLRLNYRFLSSFLNL